MLLSKKKNKKAEKPKIKDIHAGRALLNIRKEKSFDATLLLYFWPKMCRQMLINNPNSPSPLPDSEVCLFDDTTGNSKKVNFLYNQNYLIKIMWKNREWNLGTK